MILDVEIVQQTRLLDDAHPQDAARKVELDTDVEAFSGRASGRDGVAECIAGSIQAGEPRQAVSRLAIAAHSTGT